MHPKDLSIKDFNYSLPEDRIARYPLAERDDSKLLIYNKGQITEDKYRNLAQQLPEGSLLLFNNSKVVEARILFQKPTGGMIEIFCLEPAESYPDITSAMLQKGKVHWQCLVGGASKWKRGQVLEKKVGNPSITLQASYIEKKAGSFIIELSWQPSDYSFAEILHLTGAMPLPPYIKRNAEPTDSERYQTIYALHDGSVAAPTAGLHFTDHILNELKKRNIQTDFVTLHVGAGTFKPVQSETMSGHDMHAEFIDVSRNTINTILENIDRTIIPVGTTSLRTLESLYWLGVQQLTVNSQQSTVDSQGRDSSQLAVGQWDPYEYIGESISQEQALKALIKWMDKYETDRLLAKTQIIIAPGYRLKLAKALVTNFHQPQSTLLLLIAALVGDDWKRIYAYAMENDFRFLSYGDGCLLWDNFKF